jgi:hypothetical protein
MSSNAPETHSSSRWAEPAREDGLTLWEVNRKPRKVERTDRSVRCHTKSLNPHLRCAICLGYLKETTIVMVCLHRFCSECINKCIRLGMKECPNCRKSIPSRRSLRRDLKFDNIVNSMIGDPEIRQISEEERGKTDANRMVHLQRAIDTNHLVEQEKRAAGLRQRRPQSFRNRPRATYVEESPLLEIELRRHPREDKVDHLERSFLTIRGDAKVSILKAFLQRKLEDQDFEISSSLDDASVVLHDALPLIEAKQTLCADAGVMVLKYRIPNQNDAAGEASEPEIVKAVRKVP